MIGYSNKTKVQYQNIASALYKQVWEINHSLKFGNKKGLKPQNLHSGTNICPEARNNKVTFIVIIIDIDY